MIIRLKWGLSISLSRSRWPNLCPINTRLCSLAIRIITQRLVWTQFGLKTSPSFLPHWIRSIMPSSPLTCCLGLPFHKHNWTLLRAGCCIQLTLKLEEGKFTPSRIPAARDIRFPFMFRQFSKFLGCIQWDHSSTIYHYWIFLIPVSGCFEIKVSGFVQWSGRVGLGPNKTLAHRCLFAPLKLSTSQKCHCCYD